MAMNISQSHAKQAMERYDSLKRRIAGMRDNAEKTTKTVIRTAEVGGAAFGIGLIQGRTGGVEVFGVPLELGLGIGLNIFGLFGGAGAYSDHLHNVGDGCIAAYATTLGRGVGTTMRSKSLGGGAAKPLAASKGERLTVEEVAEMAGIPR
jgi:hypothetical protein